MAFDAGAIEASMTLDRSPFQEGLRLSREEASKLERERITPTVSLETGRFTAEVHELLAELDRLAREHPSPTVRLEAANARAELVATNVELDRLDHRRADVQVLVDTARSRGELDRFKLDLDYLDRKVAKARIEVDDAEAHATKVRELEKLDEIDRKVARPRVDASGISPAIALVVAVLPAVVALAASLGAAAGGAAVMGVALVGALGPAAILIAAVAARAKDFKDQFVQVGHQLQQTLKPATDAVFGGLLDALHTLVPTMQALSPAFTVLGRAWGDVFEHIARVLKGLTPEFDTLTRGAAKLSTTGGQIFGDLLKILTRIAVAAMPYLIKGFEAVAKTFDGWAKGTENSKQLSRIVGMLVDQLKSWLHLIGAVADLMLGFLKAAAPAGQHLVDWLAAGARHLAAWVNSAHGQAQIQKFFHDMIPLVKELVTFIGRMGIGGAQLLQFFGPSLTGILHLLNQLPAPVAGAILLFAKFGGAISTMASVALTAFRAIGVAASFLMANPIVLAIAAVIAVAVLVATHWKETKRILSDIWHTIRDMAIVVWHAIANAIIDPVKAVVNWVVAAWHTGANAIGSVWNAIGHGASAIWGGISHTITSAVRSVIGWVTNAWSDAGRFLGRLWQNVSNAAVSMFNGVVGAGKSAINAIIALFNNGIDLINQITPGAIKAFGETIVPAIPDIPHIPHLARGGLIREMGLAIVGEMGPELLRLPQGAQVDPLPHPVPRPLRASDDDSRGRRGLTIEKQEVTITAPAGHYPDDRVTAALLAQQLRNMGGIA